MRQQAEQENRFDQDICSGKMSQEHFQAIKEKTSGQSLKKLQESRTAQYQSLCLKNGRMQEASWEMIILSHGECLMLNTSEFPSVEKESTLSQILEVTPHPKYYLSKTACEGILKRAEKRGKILPTMLEMALKKQIERYDAFDRAAFNQGMNAKYDIGITKDIAQTIHGTYAMQGFGDYKSSDTASSIKQRDFKDAADLVVAFEPGTVSRIGGHFYEDGKTGTLRAKPGDNQQTIISEYIVRRLTPTECGRLQGFPDGWADNLAIENPTEDDILYWQMVFKEHPKALGIDKKEKTDNQIRKWLQNPESDSAKYKMWGNGIALPCAMMVMEKISEVIKRGG